MAARKAMLGKSARLARLLLSAVDPRAWAHLLKIVNYYNYTHVAPLRRVRIGSGAAISPNASFLNPERIEIGRNFRIGARSALWAGPGEGRIRIGDDVLLGPDVLITAANYRFNDGRPVTRQAMDEADVEIGDDVWLGARVLVMPGVTIGPGAVIGAGAVVTRDVAPMTIAVGSPARAVGRRRSPAEQDGDR